MAINQNGDIQQCGNCHFCIEGDIDKNNITNKIYFCRRYPPTSHLIPVPDNTGNLQMGQQAFFPMIRVDNWCGEWQLREGGE